MYFFGIELASARRRQAGRQAVAKFCSAIPYYSKAKINNALFFFAI